MLLLLLVMFFAPILLLLLLVTPFSSPVVVAAAAGVVEMMWLTKIIKLCWPINLDKPCWVHSIKVNKSISFNIILNKNLYYLMIMQIIGKVIVPFLNGKHVIILIRLKKTKTLLVSLSIQQFWKICTFNDLYNWLKAFVATTKL